MRIATATKDPATNRYRFDVSLPFLPPAVFEIEKTESTHERAPDWNILHGGERCGALWRRLPKGASGESFLSGSIESPVFPGGRLEVAVFHSKTVGGALEMTWRPENNQRSPAPAPDPSHSTTSTTAPTAPTGDDDRPPF